MESSSTTTFKPRMLESLADAYLLAGRLEEAEGLAGEALAAARYGGDRGTEAWVLRLHGELASRRDPSHLAPAADSYRRALALATEFRMRPLMAHCRLALGRLYRCTDERLAADHLSCAVSLYREMGMTLDLATAEAALAALTGVAAKPLRS